MSEHDEMCQRCGEVGEDRRTLWMACFYAMNELGLPFKQVAIRGVVQEQTGVERLEFLNAEVPVFSYADGAVERQNQFFTLRVCKDCRADWLHSIKAWFGNVEKREETGTGVFLRKNGATYEASQEEAEALKARNGQ